MSNHATDYEDNLLHRLGDLEEGYFVHINYNFELCGIWGPFAHRHYAEQILISKAKDPETIDGQIHYRKKPTD